MKNHYNKLFLFSLSALLIGFTSCNKDYTCTCTYTTSGYTQKTVTVIPNTTKHDADNQCTSNEHFYHLTRSGPVVSTVVKCSL